MNVLRKIVLLLGMVGVAGSVFAYDVVVYNKTPFPIQVKAKCWQLGNYQGLFDSDWVRVPAGSTAKATPKGLWSALIAGIYVKAEVPGKDEVDLGYYGFWNTTFSRASDQAAVVGVEPIFGQNGESLKGFKFFVGHVHGIVMDAPAEKVVNIKAKD